MISGGKVTGKSGGTYAALQSRLAAGRGKAASASRMSRAFKTPWAKGKPKISKGDPTFAVSGATPGGLKKRGK